MNELIYEVVCPDCGGVIAIAAHTHGELIVADDPNLPEVYQHVMWNPDIHPTFVGEQEPPQEDETRVTTVSIDAADRRHGLTTAELADLVAELAETGASGDEPIAAEVTIRGRIKRMSVEVEG